MLKRAELKPTMAVLWGSTYESVGMADINSLPMVLLYLHLTLRLRDTPDKRLELQHILELQMQV